MRGARAWQTFILANGVAVTPELRARALYDILTDPRAYTATFAADPTATVFPVTGILPDRAAALLGAGLTARFTPMWRAFLNYDAERRGGEIAHTVTGGFKANW
jgi:outer membrane autotransporter protein